MMQRTLRYYDARRMVRSCPLAWLEQVVKRLVPADEYDREEAENWGRPFTFSIEDERSSHGKDVFSPRFDCYDDDQQSEPA